ncbi:tripartite tricarboxylate transporter substrate binding protein [Cupriavidus sp. PET2-C1]
MSRLALGALVCSITASTPAISADPAAGYPSRPIRVIVPFPAGGTTDTMMRLLAPKLMKELGQPIVVDNKAGAAATLGADAAAKATPDGYTLLAGSAHHTIAQAVLPKLSYSFDKDLAPIALVAIVPNVVVVNEKVKARTIQELIQDAKAHPDKYNYASAGSGSAHHLIGEMFKLRTGAPLTHIPYRGSAPAVSDLIGGQVSVMFDTVTSALPQIKAGKTRALAVTTATRSSALPNVPTLAEAGVPGMDIGTWFGLLAPAATPPSILAKLNAAVVKVVNDPGVKKQLLDQGIEPHPSSQAEFAALIKKEMVDFKTLVVQAKLTLD